MQLYFTDDTYDIKSVSKSIFLAGPSPRGGKHVNTWRHDVIKQLHEKGYDGVVFVPLLRVQYLEGDFETDCNYDNQIEWENKWLNAADAILTWIPRTKEMMGLTTNIEVGKYLDSFRLFYGRPDDALNIRYIDKQCEDRGLKINNTLDSLIDEVLNFIGDGINRNGIAVTIPSLYYHKKPLRDWLLNIELMGNELRHIQCVNPTGSMSNHRVFLFTVKSSIFITKEKREKKNEDVLFRSNLCLVVPYYVDEHNNRYIILVDEFRQAGLNEAGKVLEFPSGGYEDSHISPCDNAVKEFGEEVGVTLDKNDVTFVGCHQIYATLCASKVYIYKTCLSKENFTRIYNMMEDGVTLGENSDERIKLHILNHELLMNQSHIVDTLTLAAYFKSFYS